MLKPVCDNCNKELSEAPTMISTQEVIFFDKEGQPRFMRNLHHCDPRCLNSTIIKAFNRPNIVTLAK